MPIDRAIESMWLTYSNINDLIKFADVKAGAILALNGVVLSIILKDSISNKIFLLDNFLFAIFLYLGILSGILSIITSIYSLKPNMSRDTHSLIYFRSIYKKYNSILDYNKAVLDVFSCELTALSQISDEVWLISGIAFRKFNIVNWAIWFLLGETISFALAGTILLIYNK